MYSPLVTPDYVPYIAQMANVDAAFTCIGGGTVRFIRQYSDLGMTKTPLFGGQTTLDDSLLKNLGDEAVGVVTASCYTASIDTPSNRSFVEETVRDYGNIPGAYAAGLYLIGMVVEAALAKTGGKVDDREAFVAAMRAVSLTDSPRGPLSFDRFGNAVGNIYILRAERKNGALVNTIIKTYPNVSQFWTYDPTWFLSQPVYARDYPPAKNLE
jgi:branched-chain amino acid transport system substrate-binding protein